MIFLSLRVVGTCNLTPPGPFSIRLLFQLLQRTGVTSLAALGTASGDWLLTASFSAPLKLWHLPSAGSDLANLKKVGDKTSDQRASLCMEILVEVAEKQTKNHRIA